jgi:membrane-bound lytic murein transglycosylase B
MTLIRSLPGALAAGLLLLAGTPATAQSDPAACLSGLRSQAASNGISGPVFDTATRGFQPDLRVLELQNNQPEFKTPIWDYLGALVDEERVQDGRAAMRQWGQALAQARRATGWTAM